MKDIAIIGAGPMGLAAAWHLRESHRITIFEAADRPGGMSASFDFDGLTIEKYYHFINTPDKYLFDLLAQLDLTSELRWTNTKMGLYRPDKNGHARLLPFGNPLALAGLPDIGMITKLRYAAHMYSCKFLRDLDNLDKISAKDWICAWEGSKGYDFFWKFLFEKKFFNLADPLSAAWIASRIRRVANSRENLMREKLGYLEGGSEILLQTLCAAMNKTDAQINLNARVTNIIPQADGGAEIIFNGKSQKFAAVISTVPMPYLPQIASRLPAGWLEKAARMHNIGCACALFRLGKPLTENFWLNVDMPGWDAPGIIEYSNLRPMDKAYVYVPFYMPHNHPNWKANDDAMLAKARGYLAAINPEAASLEECACLFRYEYAQPVCQPGFGNVLPPLFTGAQGIYAADTARSFPEDRSINESVRIGRELAMLALQHL